MANQSYTSMVVSLNHLQLCKSIQLQLSVTPCCLLLLPTTNTGTNKYCLSSSMTNTSLWDHLNIEWHVHWHPKPRHSVAQFNVVLYYHWSLLLPCIVNVKICLYVKVWPSKKSLCFHYNVNRGNSYGSLPAGHIP